MIRVNYFILVFIIALVNLSLGCVQQDIKENQVYIVEKNRYHDEDQLQDELRTEGRIPFMEQLNDSDLAELFEEGQILLTVTSDGGQLYLMELLDEQEGPITIKGKPQEKVRIIKVDRNNKDKKIVAENIPFVSLVKWNMDESLVAFGGGDRLTIYDTHREELILNEELANELVVYFAWSPTDENKIYTENPNLVNGSIYYVNSQKKLEAYETREENYFKGKLDNNYFYGTSWDFTDDSINTVILDKQGKVVKVLAKGRYRDAYQKSILTVDDSGFGLYYIQDINRNSKVKILSHDYIYDVKFVADGKIAYTVKKVDADDNTFYLNILDKNGKREARLEVSGGAIAVTPDGKVGYTGGPKGEKLDFHQNEVVAKNTRHTVEAQKEQLNQINTVIRHGMKVLYDAELSNKRDVVSLKRYFIDTASPAQWAYTDLFILFNEMTFISDKKEDSNYRMDIQMMEMDFNEGGNQISTIIQVATKTPSGTHLPMLYSLELIKQENIWYMTGFSTYPHSIQRQELQQEIERYVKEAVEGQLFPNVLTDKVVEVGQIQFWRTGRPHLASSVETANACKVYLKVFESDSNNSNPQIYKLVLEKRNQHYWRPVKLTSEELSYL